MPVLMCKYHHGDLISAHPCKPGKDYSFANWFHSMFATVSGQTITIHVLEIMRRSSKKDANVTFNFLDHALLRERPNHIAVDDNASPAVYPAPETRLAAVQFFSAIDRLFEAECVPVSGFFAQRWLACTSCSPCRSGSSCAMLSSRRKFQHVEAGD